MSLAFNSSGLVTMGLGPSHRLCTIGMGQRFDFGGYPRIKNKIKEYLLNLRTTIQKENVEEFDINSSVGIIKERYYSINSAVSKQVTDDINIQTELNHSNLLGLLDEI